MVGPPVTDEPLTPFDENGRVRDLTELGFYPVGTISDTVEFSAISNGPPMVISGHTVDYRPIPIVVPGAPWLLPPEPAHEPVDIVDRIDELVNDQLANYGNRSGYDNNVNQDLCPHCDREWHGLRITARIEQMRSFGHFDESYRYADDYSEVLCEGSEFIGPMKYGPKQAAPCPVTAAAVTENQGNSQWRVIQCDCGCVYHTYLPAMPFGGICRASITCRNCERTNVVDNNAGEHPATSRPRRGFDIDLLTLDEPYADTEVTSGD